MAVLYFKALGSENLLFTKVAFNTFIFSHIIMHIFMPPPAIVGGEHNVFGLSV